MTIRTGQKKKEAIVMHGVYSSVANYWTNFLAIYRGTHIWNCSPYCKLLFICSTIPRVKFYVVVRNFGRETLFWHLINTAL